MGTFFKECEHPEVPLVEVSASLQDPLPQCGGKQSEESGFATQSNAFDKLRTILLDANRLGIFDENPMEGVVAPQYDPARDVIPSLDQLRANRTAGDDAFLLIADMMSGCGLRNGEPAAVNINNIVADDVCVRTAQAP